MQRFLFVWACKAKGSMRTFQIWKVYSLVTVRMNHVYRGYYTAALRYEFYFRAVKTIFYEGAQRVSKILLFTTRK